MKVGDRVRATKKSIHHGKCGTIKSLSDNKVHALVMFDKGRTVPVTIRLRLLEPENQSDLITKASERNEECEHQWATYYGLIECFEYCTVCDTKADKRRA
jgi:hypothetical protein